MLSPITAPRIAAAIIAGSGIRPAAAATPPKITAISPGNTNPMKADDSSAGSKNTASNAAHPGSASSRSGIDAVMVCAGYLPAPPSSSPPRGPWPRGEGRSRVGARAIEGPSDLLDVQRVLPVRVPAVPVDEERARLGRAEGDVLVGGRIAGHGRDRRARAAPTEATRRELPDVLRPRIPDPQIEVLSPRPVEADRVSVALHQALLVDVIVVGGP